MPTTAVPLVFTQTDSFVALLRQLGASLWVTTYQAQQLLVMRADGDGLSMLVRTFEKPMGLAVETGRVALGTRDRVWFLRNAPDLASRIEPLGKHDACFLPRSCHITGDIAGHEVAWVGDELWLVNTRFSCLCTAHPDYSFVPRWRPPFVSALTAEDRCHLNGVTRGVEDAKNQVATRQFLPRFATALATTDVAQGWRANKATGGCLIDVPSGEIIMRGLCMPHSPRIHNNRLWLLESGTGRLLTADAASGRQEIVAEVPGFARGLAMAGPFAFIGLSKIRATSAMDGVPLAERRDQLQCGIAVVDCRSGQIVARLEFQTAVEEIFDVQLLIGARFPEVIGFQKGAIQHTFVVPPIPRT